MYGNQATSESSPPVERVSSELHAVRKRARLRERLLCQPARDAWRDIDQKLSQWEERIEREGADAIRPALAHLRELIRAAEEFLDDAGLEEAPLDSAVTRVMRPLLPKCRPEDSLGTATQIMWDHDCTAVPVVDRDESLLGIVTDRDACMACHGYGVSPDEISVGTIMTRGVASCRMDESIEKALELMAAQGLERIVVVGLAQEPMGVVTLGDVARFVQTLAPEARARGSELAGRALAGDKPAKAVFAPSRRPRRTRAGLA